MIENKGFTLLIAVLVVSIMLGISVGISSIITGQIILSNTGVESQKAFYAADAGVECAAFWDVVHTGNGFDSNDPSVFATTTSGDNEIVCDDNGNPDFDVGGRNSCVASLDGSGSQSTCIGGEDKKAGKSEFTINFGNGSCARVTVIRRQDDPVNPTGIETFIHADGFNIDCDSTSPRVFQRSLETTTYGLD